VNPSSFENPQAELDRSLEWRETLDQVDPEMRWVLWQMVWGYSVKEIAERLGVKPATLYKRLSRARKELQKKRIDSNPSSAGRSKENGEKPKRR
jgi:DNA-directed RNA polymerase specialized sigma24 family protein